MLSGMRDLDFNCFPRTMAAVLPSRWQPGRFEQIGARTATILRWIPSKISELAER